MSRKFLDLSVSLQEGIKSDPDFMLPKINYLHHQETAEEMISFFPGLNKSDLPGGEGWAMETITVSTHIYKWCSTRFSLAVVRIGPCPEKHSHHLVVNKESKWMGGWVRVGLGCGCRCGCMSSVYVCSRVWRTKSETTLQACQPCQRIRWVRRH